MLVTLDHVPAGVFPHCKKQGAPNVEAQWLKEKFLPIDFESLCKQPSEDPNFIGSMAECSPEPHTWDHQNPCPWNLHIICPCDS